MRPLRCLPAHLPHRQLCPGARLRTQIVCNRCQSAPDADGAGLRCASSARPDDGAGRGGLCSIAAAWPALAPADWLELSAGGCCPLWLDDSPCATCAIGAAQSTLHQAVDAADAASGRESATCAAPAQRTSARRGGVTVAPAAVRRRPARHQPPGAAGAFAPRSARRRCPSWCGWKINCNVVRARSARLPHQVPASRRRLLAVFAA